MNTNLEWPGLDYWYDLPEGVTIPAGMRYAFWRNDGEIAIRTTPIDWRPVVGYGHYRTETPIVRPLPTEPGEIIRVGRVLTLVPDSPAPTAGLYSRCA